MGCFWLADSWIYFRGPHAFICDSPSEIFPNLPLLRDLSDLCCSAVKLPLQFLFPLLAWGKHFKDPATWYFFSMFNSNASLTSEYCKQAQWPGLPKLRWSTGVAEFWSGEWNLKVQDMKRDENQSDNLRHLKTVCLDGLPLNRLLLCCFWGLPSQSSGPQDKTNYIFTERFSFSSGFACFNPCIVLEKSDE